MSRKTHYKTFTQPALPELEKEVNDFIRSLYKDEKIDGVKINSMTTLNVNNAFVVAMTFSYGKKKKPVEEVVAAQETV